MSTLQLEVRANARSVCAAPNLDGADLPPFLRCLSDCEREATLLGAGVLRIPANATILEPGQAGVWLVVQGLVRYFTLTPDGRQPVLRHAVPGEAVGLTSLFTEYGAFFAQTVVESKLVNLDWARVRDALRNNPVASQAAAAEVIERAHEALEAAGSRSYQTVAQRIGEYVLDLLSRVSGGQTALPLTQQELANAVGCSREAVSRCLGVLRREGLVQIAPARLVVLQPDRLRTAAHCSPVRGFRSADCTTGGHRARATDGLGLGW